MQLTQFQQVVYLITLSAAVISTGFLIAPVSLPGSCFGGTPGG